VHFEVFAADDGQLAAFYGELFGWELAGSSGAGYTTIDTRGGGGINGGIGRSQTGRPWSTLYVETDDPQATLDKANALGGTTVFPLIDRGDSVTATAMFSDPDGLLIGLIPALADRSQGNTPSPSAGSGAPVTWFEILGSDAARTQQFYGDLFGWTIDRSGLPEYAVVDTASGRGLYGGIGGGLETRWAILYAGVADVDHTLRLAEKLGGSRVDASDVTTLKRTARTALYGSADDIDTGWLRDPAGNVFGLSHKKTD
jgi:predicted enzyme related to lactoylglutathione lyase